MEHLDPEQLEKLLAGYVLGDLTPEESVRVKQHLEAHPEFAAEVNRLQATLALLPLSLAKTSPSETLRERLLQTAQASLSSSTARPSSRVWRTGVWIWVIRSAAAVLLAGLGFSVYRLNQELEVVQDDLSRYQEAIALLRQPNNRLLTLKGMSPTLPSSGSLVIAPQSHAGVLTLQNLPPLPEGKVYRLWAFTNGQKVNCAEFTPNSEGKVFLQLPLDNWAGTTSVVVTVEPFQETPEPTGEMVMTGGQLL